MKHRARRTSVGQGDIPSLPADFGAEDSEPPPLDFDDDTWEAFLPDDQPDPLPEPGDFWIETDRLNEHLPAA